MIKIGFDTKFSTFVLFYEFLVGTILHNKVAMETKKGLSMICKFQNSADTYIRK